MVPRIQTQPSTASSVGEESHRSGITSSAGRRMRKQESQKDFHNHILSKFGYSPKRSKKTPERHLIQRKSPSRPQQSLHDSSLHISGGTDNDGESSVVNPYRMLQIRRDATQSEIKQAYRRLALWHHPNRQSAIPKRERERRLRIFVVLAACCETLLERESRTRLDALLRARPRRRPLPASTSTTTATLTPTWRHSQQQSRRTGFRDSSNTGADLPILYLSHSNSSSDLSSTHTGTEEEIDAADRWLDWAYCGAATPKASSRSRHNRNNNNNQQQQHAPARTLTSCSTEDADRIHYTHKETNRLFGGPLSLMYRARSFRSFTDPYVIFDRIFGGQVFPSGNNNRNDSSCSTPPKTKSSSTTTTTALTKASTTTTSAAALPGPLRNSAWSGSIESRKDGTTIYTTARILNGRRLIKREVIGVDPRTGQKQSTITVEGEDLYPPDDDDDDDKYSKQKQSSTEIGYWTCCAPRLLFASDNTTTTSHSRRAAAEDDTAMTCTNLPMAIFHRMNDCVVW